MDEHIRIVMKDAPDIVHHLYALHGANQVLTSLTDEGARAAHLIWFTSCIVCAINEALQSKKPSNAPSDIHFHAIRAKNLFMFSPQEYSSCQLALLEDLYYAIVAKLKEFLQQANTLLENRFKGPDEVHVVFTTQPLEQITQLRLSDFRSCALIQQDLLLGEPMTRLLDDSLQMAGSERPSSSLCLLPQGTRILEMQRLAAKTNVDELRYPWFQRLKRLHNVTRMSSGMLFAHLAEKYQGPRFGLENLPTPANVPSTTESPRYISPYNLDERVKRFRGSNRPEKPCICDPECVCAPLCASEPHSNCLCEENGLFVRVTEGMDIDDLAVPDLVRRRKSSSDASTISIRSVDEIRAEGDSGVFRQKCEDRDIGSEIDQEKQEQMTFHASYFGSQGSRELESFRSHAFVPDSIFADILRAPALGKTVPEGMNPVFDPTYRLPFAHKCTTPPKEARKGSAVKRFISGNDSVQPGKRFKPRFVRALGISETFEAACAEI